jgi:ketosteroid isomerase-like protein
MAPLNPAPRGLKLLGVFLVGLVLGGGGVGLILHHQYANVGDTDSQIRAVLLRQQEAWNAGDLERFVADYWENEALTFFSDGTIEQGPAALLTRYRKRYQSEGKEMGTLTFSDLDITPMGADAATARGRWKVVKKEKSSDGLFTLALRQFPDGWKITHDHTSQTEKKP